MKTRRVLITFHSLADVDAVCSALALHSVLPKSVVVAPDHPNAQARRVIKYAEKLVPLLSDVDVSKFDAVVLLDTNTRVLIPQAAGWKNIALIIDHHHPHADCFHAPVEFIDNTASSACELVAQIIGEENVSPDAAWLLCLGMITDSAHFRNARPSTFATFAKLLARSPYSYSRLLALSTDHLDISARQAVLTASRKLEFTRVGDVLISKTLSDGGLEALVAHSLHHAGADVVFVGHASKHGSVRLSARAHHDLCKVVDLPGLMATAGRMLGGSGGGHPCAAGANGNRPEKLGEALDYCYREAIARVKRAQAKK